VTSASVEPIFAQPIAGTSVEITNSSGIHAIPIGEYVLASMLAFARRFRPLLERQQHHHWALPEEIYRSLVGVELRGAVLGIVGYGSIGREVARLGTAFGTRVLACKRDPASRADPGWRPEGVGDPEGSIPEAFFGPSGLHEMLGRSDFVVVTCPLTPETAGLIDAAALATMRPGAYLVNVSRGGIVDEPALIEALRAGRIGGAGLDVTAREPLPAESPLFDLPNVLVTPHCSGTTAAYNDRAVEVFCENLRRHLAGRPLLNRIDRALRY
jgi:phosphoglycerate dehydrogenase-like enzyme